jgi:hypothetical protein
VRVGAPLAVLLQLGGALNFDYGALTSGLFRTAGYFCVVLVCGVAVVWFNAANIAAFAFAFADMTPCHVAPHCARHLWSYLPLP